MNVEDEIRIYINHRTDLHRVKNALALVKLNEATTFDFKPVVENFLLKLLKEIEYCNRCIGELTE